ncbi:DNA translocase FtsK [Streptomyces glaucosporus]|uniref:DNA translocase FtsK n=1 Tax=Streptomyces glaucosporus TaxID=284044 RepID=UPI0031CFDFE7
MEDRLSRENAPSDARTKAVIRLSALLTVAGLLVLLLGAVLGSLPLLVGGGLVFAAAGLGVLAVRRGAADRRGTIRERDEEPGTAAAETPDTVPAEREREEEQDEEKKEERREPEHEPEPEPEAADTTSARQETDPEAPQGEERPEPEAANALRNAVRELLSSLPEREAPLEKAIAYCLSRTDSADDPWVRDEAEKLAREHVAADERILCVALSGSREDEERPALLVLTDHGAAVSDRGTSHRFVPGPEDVFDPVGDAAWGWLSVGELTFFFRDNPDLRAALAVREETATAVAPEATAVPTVDEPVASADEPGSDEAREPEALADESESVASAVEPEPVVVEPAPATDEVSKTLADEPAAPAVAPEATAVPTVDEPVASADEPGSDEAREPEALADESESVASAVEPEPVVVEPAPATDEVSKTLADEPESAAPADEPEPTAVEPEPSAVEPTVAEESVNDESPDPEAPAAEAEVEAPRTSEHPQDASDNDSPADERVASNEESDGRSPETEAPAVEPEPVASVVEPESVASTVETEPVAPADEPAQATDEVSKDSAVEPERPAAPADEPATSAHEPFAQQAEAAGMEAETLREIAQAVVTDQNASIVYVQERFSLSRAAARRALDALEALGLVSAPAKNGRRKAMATSLDHLTPSDER